MSADLIRELARISDLVEHLSAGQKKLRADVDRLHDEIEFLAEKVDACTLTPGETKP